MPHVPMPDLDPRDRDALETYDRAAEDGPEDPGFVLCPDCDENYVDPDYTGNDGRSVCDDCREASS